MWKNTNCKKLSLRRYISGKTFLLSLHLLRHMMRDEEDGPVKETIVSQIDFVVGFSS